MRHPGVHIFQNPELGVSGRGGGGLALDLKSVKYPGDLKLNEHVQVVKSESSREIRPSKITSTLPYIFSWSSQLIKSIHNNILSVIC